ncbi:MAG: hypothetical protein IH899_14715 [Planctomycetes bacterium]|nr:hypothetical protein [Planctomycetota bacterium]
MQYLWLTSKLWFLRVCRSFVNYPGWTIAALTGCIGIILLLIVQIEAFFPKSASEAEPLIEPFLEITDEDVASKKHNSAKIEVLHDDSANGHPSQIETNAQPVFDIDVVLFPLQGVQEDPEQFLVTSVREQHPLNHLPIRTGKSLWRAFGLNHNRIAIQPTEYQSPEFRNEPRSAESFVEPFLTKPVHNGIPYFAADILSSAFSTRVTLAGTTIAETKTAETMTEQAMTEQTTIAETPKLNLVVTISDRTQLGQPERIQFRVINSGQVTAMNVILSIEIPEEFTYQKGQSLEYKVGTIPPGETRLARLTPKAAKTGVAVFEIEVTADEGFSHILKPQVEIVAGE